ncbi:unnamed protein product [Brachionus calyciflorus]|uniref:Ig-like domain-containing protein n=1 Tax=Brachionus calyciflorus TaxID=104777 RepID=A0A813N509_9BILA|nr:unnamed protein product [Brachionus calyciflorus]
MKLEILSFFILLIFISSISAKKRVHNRNTLNRKTVKNKLEDNKLNDHDTKIQIVNVTAKVGEAIVLNCAINSTLNPGAIWTQGKIGNVLTFNTNRITVDPRFDVIQHSVHKEDDPNDPNLILPKQAFQNDVNYYNLQIENVQLYDENEYACQTSITKSNEDEPLIHSLIHLHVTQSPSFFESQTSESNIAGLENGEVILKCTATGKPIPRIKWYKLDENSGVIRDLDHESTSLVIKNLSKHDQNKYECVASNGILPSVSKKFTLTVYFAPIISTIQPHINHNSGQTVVTGCVVSSNPDSTITWFKYDNQTKINNKFISSYFRIDESDLDYTINKIKQSNQTISYLKIKNITQKDLVKFKCEASNVIGKTEAIIDLMNFKDSIFVKKYKTDRKLDEIDKKDGQYALKRKSDIIKSNSKVTVFSNSESSPSDIKNDGSYRTQGSSNQNSLFIEDNVENKSIKLSICLYNITFLVFLNLLNGF